MDEYHSLLAQCRERGLKSGGSEAMLRERLGLPPPKDRAAPPRVFPRLRGAPGPVARVRYGVFFVRRRGLVQKQSRVGGVLLFIRPREEAAAQCGPLRHGAARRGRATT